MVEKVGQILQPIWICSKQAKDGCRRTPVMPRSTDGTDPVSEKKNDLVQRNLQSDYEPYRVEGGVVGCRNVLNPTI